VKSNPSTQGSQRHKWLSRRLFVWPPFFAAILFYVCAVSAYDGYLVVRTGDEIREFERNPIGLLLINCDGGSPCLFLVAKAAGTLLVLYLLRTLNHRSQRLARPVTFAIALFQSGLLIFLEKC
jgi:hypothetical protein